MRKEVTGVNIYEEVKHIASGIDAAHMGIELLQSLPERSFVIFCDPISYVEFMEAAWHKSDVKVYMHKRTGDIISYGRAWLQAELSETQRHLCFLPSYLQEYELIGQF